jgi:hypothetical protein
MGGNIPCSPTDSLGHPLGLGKPLDPATSNAIVEDLKRTVPMWRDLYEPLRVNLDRVGCGHGF